MPAPDLPYELRALAAQAAWPPTPDLAAAVAARLAREAPAAHAPRRRRAALRRAPRRLVVALVAALLVVPAGALALPGPRHAILDALGLRHVTVERRPAPLPPAARDPHLGERTTLARAAGAAGFAPRVPAALGPPDRIFYRDGIVTLAYDHRLLFAQAAGRLDRDVLSKVIAVDAHARSVRVAGAPGLFLAASHAYQWLDATGPLVRSGPALIWERDGRVFRLEGERSLRRALTIAASAR
ncbi:MAG TPA: hypothetical protein VK501_25815 [Baekduia sp.]|uniref:hypothetical protein n=1 Tax=Baekduia sp. TaxID=2600305 RepID=UPI002B5DAEA4|nr:hypothetical protein [Baekduia sp.]HMJ37348.1 hypothetical protein [Baekduia sp.]